jgi:hypothetical protein
MDYLLYFLILIIVIATGYVLSKPLIKPLILKKRSMLRLTRKNTTWS